MRVLRGMADLGSIRGTPVAAVPTADLAWSGWLGDRLLAYLPAGMVGQLGASLAIAIAFVLIAQKNSMEISTGRLSVRLVMAAAVAFSVAVYFMLAQTSAVFLYFNF